MTTDATTLEKKKTYLDILAVFHYVNGGLSALVAMAAVAFLGIGLGATTEWGRAWEPEAGCALTAIIAFVLVLVGGYAVLNLITARALQTRSNYVLCLVTSALNCVNMPFGTLLGIFSLVLLSDGEVRAIFRGETAALPAHGGYAATAGGGHPTHSEGYGQEPTDHRRPPEPPST